MPKACFNDTIHSPLRLRICGLLRNVDRIEFARLRGFLNISDATLSKHLKVLVDAGFAVANKEASLKRDDVRRVMWLSLTPKGRAAFDAHILALQDIANPRI